MKKLAFLTIFLTLLLVGQSAQGYTSSGGIEEDDVINVDYILTVNGEIEDQGQNSQMEVTTDRLIQGFYEGLLGMKVDTEKSFEVPPHKGYTKETDDFYGETLYFDVYINFIVRNIRDADSDGDGSVSDVLKNIGTVILVIAIGAFVIYLYSSSKSRSTNPYCEHCKSIGKKIRSEGYCSRCNNYYCRASFSKGCPNCKNNTMIPNKNK